MESRILKHRDKKLQSIGIILVVVVVGVLFFYVANLFGSENVQSDKPLVICQPQNAPPEQQKCFWTAHIHFTIKVFKGNEEIPVGFEQGELEGKHTHAEKNKVHWHGLLSVNPVTKEVTDLSPLQVGNIPKDLKLSVEGNPMFIVNGKEVNSFYIWQDGDVIEILYP